MNIILKHSTYLDLETLAYILHQCISTPYSYMFYRTYVVWVCLQSIYNQYISNK